MHLDMLALSVRLLSDERWGRISGVFADPCAEPASIAVPGARTTSMGLLDSGTA